jgi:transposase
LHEVGERVRSTDELTGVQVLECKEPDLPMLASKVERREFEDIRHGTLAFIINRDVVSGRAVSPSVRPTRTEEDFVVHVAQTVATDADAGWIFILDQLNTHQSATLVELVAALCQVAQDLGTKGQAGTLATMSSRAAFLSDPLHRIRFVYTPKHCSWLNQIEIWFSILVRRLLKRGSFASLVELHSRILEFIAYFNRTMAKAFAWTSRGRPLAA